MKKGLVEINAIDPRHAGKKKTLLQLLLALHFSEPYGKELLIKTLEIFNDQIHKASFPAICSCDSQ